MKTKANDFSGMHIYAGIDAFQRQVNAQKELVSDPTC
jgi:hypothetical protein